eukprot:GHRR01036185.1.p1 GENE.GHRR01036185.1~~GHRR01036185.1.p1  ORF type:complete len:120 (-),score=15.90 GHRR01036185.1:306-665(-)
MLVLQGPVALGWHVSCVHNGSIVLLASFTKPIKPCHLGVVQVYAEGTHLMVPWFERPVIFDVRARPSLIQSQSGSRDLQMVSCVLIVVKVGSSCMYRIQSVSVQDPGVQFCLAAKAHGR